MKNFVQAGDTITVTAPANFDSGEGCLIGGLFGVCCGDAANGESLDIALTGVFDLPKVSTHVFAVGDSIYWDSDAKQCHSGQDADSNSAGTYEGLIGSAVAVAGAGAATVRVRLGMPVTLS